MNHTPINIRNISVKCGNCETYQTLSGFATRPGWNVYTYECENGTCDPVVTRTLIEVPSELDEFARRDPGWRGGGRHGAVGPGGSGAGEPGG
ncbi:MAG: hypothetical protein ACREMB_13025 [Candidatus Rokuibacteriota bacterium]